MLWTVLAGVAAALIGGSYGLSLSNLFGGETEFYDCDRNGVSVGILYAPIACFILSMVAVALLGALRQVARAFSIPD